MAKARSSGLRNRLWQLPFQQRPTGHLVGSRSICEKSLFLARLNFAAELIFGSGGSAFDQPDKIAPGWKRFRFIEFRRVIGDRQMEYFFELHHELDDFCGFKIRNRRRNQRIIE